MSTRRSRITALGVTAAVAAAGMAQPEMAKAESPTVSVDNGRTGWDKNEPGLTPTDVANPSFGQIFKSPNLDGQVFAEPIVAGGMLVVATENNKIYGLDPKTGAIQWERGDLGPAWPSDSIDPPTGCGDLGPTVGITSAPVFDPASNTVYMTSKTYANNDPTQASWLMHAIDPGTGAERAGFPTTIQGAPSNDPSTPFDAFHAMQRPGLLLMDGVVYAAFGAHCDFTPWHGYVVGVDAASGHQTAMWTSETNDAGSGAGIWQSGGGLVSDGDGRILFATGNGVSPAKGPGASPSGHLAESVVRLQVGTDRSLKAADFFSPANNATLDRNDTDLGSGGPTALPDSFGTSKVPHLLFQEGKDGRIFLLNRDNLGGMAQGAGGTDAVVQTIGPMAGGLWGHPAVWGGDGGYVYTVGNHQPMVAFQAGATADGTPTLTQAGTTTDAFGYTSGSPIVTSNDSNSGSAVVWVVDSPFTATSSGVTGVNATLNAYSAIPDSNGTLDKLFSAPIGRASKYSVVATDSNRVYVGTRQTDTVGVVYGFGTPANTPLTTGPAMFGSVQIPGSVKKQVTLTATKPVTVTGATMNSSSPFSVDTSPLASPVTLNTGETLTLTVTFAPTAPGGANGIMTVATSAGNVGVSLNGTGLTNGLGATPNPPAFSTTQPTGTQQTIAVRIWNTGSVDEQIQSVTLPSAPFTVQGLSQGTTIGVGKSIDVPITFAPTTPGSASSQLTVVSTSGTLHVPLTGGAVSGFGNLSITPSSVNFGDVAVGSTGTSGFDVTNTGTAPLTITKAKAPTGVFSAAVPISEGQPLGPGQGIHVDMTFTPTAAGPQQAQYEITTDDGQGAMFVNINGNGVTPGTPPPPGNPGGNPVVTRLSGDNRYLTGVAVSQSHWANAGGDASGRAAAKVVVLARGDQFADALAGVPLAAKAGGPLLLTDPASLTPATLTEIRRVLGTNGGQIDVLGGEQAVSPGIVSQLTRLGYSVNRFAGADRDHTALTIAQRGLGSPQHVVLATGQDYADALAAGPFATGPAATAAGPAAVILTDGKTLAPDVRAFIASRVAQSSQGAPGAWAIGGQAVTAAAGLPGYVKPLAGATRYDTDAQVVQAAMAAGGVHQIGVATGGGFPDALTGGALTAATGGELVLVPSTLPPQIANLLSALRPQLTSVELFGGTAVISPALAGQVTTAVNGRAQ